jgi:hypothetical protein
MEGLLVANHYQQTCARGRFGAEHAALRARYRHRSQPVVTGRRPVVVVRAISHVYGALAGARGGHRLAAAAG